MDWPLFGLLSLRCRQSPSFQYLTKVVLQLRGTNNATVKDEPWVTYSPLWWLIGSLYENYRASAGSRALMTVNLGGLQADLKGGLGGA